MSDINEPLASHLFNVDKLPDAWLVLRANDGDMACFNELARRYAPMMRAYAFRFTSNDADADDVIQESLTTAWQQLSQVKKPEAIRSWLMRLTARKAIDLIRARKLHANIEAVKEPPTSSLDPPTETVARQGVEKLIEVLDTLPQSQKQVWLMREIAGLTYSEIAHDLGISVTVVRGRLARARQTLVEDMDGWR